MITLDFISELNLSDKLECLPENLPLEKDSGSWKFFQNGEPFFAQRVSETLECFIDRVLFELCEGAMGATIQFSVRVDLACIEATPSYYTEEGFPVYVF